MYKFYLCEEIAFIATYQNVYSLFFYPLLCFCLKAVIVLYRLSVYHESDLAGISGCEDCPNSRSLMNIKKFYARFTLVRVTYFTASLICLTICPNVLLSGSMCSRDSNAAVGHVLIASVVPVHASL